MPQIRLSCSGISRVSCSFFLRPILKLVARWWSRVRVGRVLRVGRGRSIEEEENPFDLLFWARSTVCAFYSGPLMSSFHYKRYKTAVVGFTPKKRERKKLAGRREKRKRENCSAEHDVEQFLCPHRRSNDGGAIVPHNSK